jgi:hypothetical protein
MNDTSKRVLHSLVPVICPPEAVPLASAIVEHMELTMGASGPMLQKGFDAGLLAYDLGALPRYFKRAHQLTGDAAEKYYASWEHGFTPAHVQLARALNQIMSLACYEQPEMFRAVGYDPVPWMAEVTKKRLTVYSDDVRKQEAQILAPDPLRPIAKKEVA